MRLKKLVTFIPRTLLVCLVRNYDYKKWLAQDLADCDSILELGCGSNSPLVQNGVSKRTDAVDIWQPYIEKHNREGNYRTCRLADILTMEFPIKAYDAVVICDVMEHLPREKVLATDLFGKMERCARKKVIIFAPNGFIENDEVDGDPYQAHVSYWEPVDYMRLGYTVKGATGLRYLFGKASIPKKPFYLCAALGLISQRFVFNHPELAWHSYAVKSLCFCGMSMPAVLLGVR